MNHSSIRKKVLITRTRIDTTAIELLNSHGFECIFSPPYAPPAEVAARLKETGAQALMVSQGRMTAEVIGASAELSIIVKHGSGVNNINLQAAESLDIPVYRGLGANARAVAEQAITLALALWKSIPRLDYATRTGNWLKGEFVGNDIRGATIGLVGFGAIGREVANIASALGMNIQVFDPLMTEAPHGITVKDDIEALLKSSDIISLHCPLTSGTRNLIDEKRLQLMQNNSVLVNTARGGIVDEQALSKALHEGTIAGAALDSFVVEPPDPNSSLWKSPNLIATPHTAGLTPGAEQVMAVTAAQHIINHFAGNPIDKRFLATHAALGGLEE
ncbi:hydroxyacid dehydrogenase [Halomonas sp. AOP5-B2-8]